MEINDIIDLVAKYQPIYYVIGIGVWCSFIIVDNFNVTQLERKLMTPKSKFLYYFSQVFLMSILTFASVILFSAGQYKEFYYNEKNEILYSTLIVVLVMIMIFHSFIVFTVKMVTNLISINFKYYYLDYNGNKWSIVRMNKNKALLVENKQMVQKFIKDPFENSYFKELTSGERKKTVLKWVDENNEILITLLLICLFIMFSSALLEGIIPTWLSFMLFLFGALSILIIASFVFASIEYIKLINEIEDNNSSN